MNIITADFNWISLLLIVGAAVFSIIKSNSKKEGAKSIFQNLGFETEDEDERIYQESNSTAGANERYIMTENTKQIIPLKKEKPVQSAYRIEEEEEMEYNSIEEEDDEFQFDIRQAIIASEILRRPEY